MSSKINTNTLSYRGYENCKNDFPIEYLVRIADTLNVSMDYLTGRTDDPTNRGEDSTNLAERIEQLEKGSCRAKEWIIKSPWSRFKRPAPGVYHS